MIHHTLEACLAKFILRGPYDGRRVLSLLATAALAILVADRSTLVSIAQEALVQPTQVSVIGRRLVVDGNPFLVRGIGYSPVPIGVDPEITPPYGDYYTSNYAEIHAQDLPWIRQMGANTIRLWGWNNTADHTAFLDAAYQNGTDPIYVVVTFWMGLSVYRDITTPSERDRIKSDFRAMVAAHKNHPAVLMWAIGNELNAPWLYGDRLVELFSLINEMALEAHLEEGSNFHPVTTALADVNLISTISAYDSAMTHVDIWSADIYRGQSFGQLFSDYAAVSAKPLVILEYGIDAYDNRAGSEYEALRLLSQAIYAESLWKEILANSNVSCGASLMNYSDEWWKGKHGQAGAGCPEFDPSFHGVCGFSTGSHPDGFANEEFWGVMRVVDNGAGIDIVEPRAAYYRLKSLWTHSIFLPLIHK